MELPANESRKLHPSPVAEHPLDHLLTEERRERYRQVLARRTIRLTVVVEECHDPHNATAIARSCEALGVHRLNVVTGRNSYKVSPRVSRGAHHYLDVRTGESADAVYREFARRRVSNRRQ